MRTRTTPRAPRVAVEAQRPHRQLGVAAKERGAGGGHIVADAKAALRELIPLVKRKRDRSWRKRVEHEVAQWW
uniref:hypothetical protein n=1 Tax=Nocardia cyriacigeorgica TaxID=135487 RepID=UPI0024548FB0